MVRVGVTCPHCSKTFAKDIPDTGGGTTYTSCPRCHESIHIKYRDGDVIEVDE